MGELRTSVDKVRRNVISVRRCHYQTEKETLRWRELSLLVPLLDAAPQFCFNPSMLSKPANKNVLQLVPNGEPCCTHSQVLVRRKVYFHYGQDLYPRCGGVYLEWLSISRLSKQ